ncbi:MAG TPA: hypothetical protein VHO91_21625 [Rhodopila sp.]|nr:hypothetical protein [Rhodopila sp.]
MSEQIARTEKQLGAIVRRGRKLDKFSTYSMNNIMQSFVSLRVGA